MLSEDETIQGIKFLYDTSVNSKKSLLEEIEKNKKLMTDLEKEVQVLDDVKTLLETLKNYKMDSKKEFILNTINAALQDVFEQNVRIDIEIAASNKSATSSITTRYDIVLYQNDIEMARNEKMLDNNGGGILSFISILFKILVGYIYSNSKFYLFDESISQVSGSYRPRLASFLKRFCEDYGFTIILVSHTDDIDEHAHVGYRLQGRFDKTGVPELSIGDIFGEYPEDNYNYVKIKNFQSIVDIEFRYKGFCIIRGDNNIGKSASFRAINALLFNTFDTNDYPRINKPRGSNVEIEFGYFKTEDDVEDNEKNHIKMIYKNGQKIVYEFDKEEYAGKSLAFEKIKEKVETLGFKYVNLKETYKNFKGNLKDQTERLALTTQHDGFYLVGSKSNETEKVFNFLFDSTAVSSAILNVDYDRKERNDRYNMLNGANHTNIRQLAKTELLIEKYLMQYYILVIKEYIYNKNISIVLNAQIVVIRDIINDVQLLINNLTAINDYKILINKYRYINQDIDAVEQGLKICSLAIKAYSDIDAFKYYIDAITKYKSSLANKDYLQNETNILDAKVKIVENALALIHDLANAEKIIYTIKIYQNLLTEKDRLDPAVNNVKLDINNLTSAWGKVEAINSEIESYQFYIQKFREYFNLKEYQKTLSIKIASNDTLISNVQQVITEIDNANILSDNIVNYKQLCNNRSNITNDINIVTLDINKLNEEYQASIEPCPYCNGSGLKHNH